MDVPVRYLIFVCAKLGEPIYKLFFGRVRCMHLKYYKQNVRKLNLRAHGKANKTDE